MRTLVEGESRDKLKRSRAKTRGKVCFDPISTVLATNGYMRGQCVVTVRMSPCSESYISACQSELVKQLDNEPLDTSEIMQLKRTAEMPDTQQAIAQLELE